MSDDDYDYRDLHRLLEDVMGKDRQQRYHEAAYAVLLTAGFFVAIVGLFLALRWLLYGH